MRHGRKRPQKPALVEMHVSSGMCYGNEMFMSHFDV